MDLDVVVVVHLLFLELFSKLWLRFHILGQRSLIVSFHATFCEAYSFFYCRIIVAFFNKVVEIYNLIVFYKRDGDLHTS